jgi:hypothetical protein
VISINLGSPVTALSFFGVPPGAAEVSILRRCSASDASTSIETDAGYIIDYDSDAMDAALV